jgi:undecaprenyl diphosphate synthase
VELPTHIAIIMDGNGRWAKKRFLPRVAGHVRGVKRVKDVIEQCLEINVKYLTLFAFGRDNWKRPAEEVSFLMNLLLEQINKEFTKLHDKNICVRFVGDRSRIDKSLVDRIESIEQLTQKNDKLFLSIALDYSGTYDITQAVNKIIQTHPKSEITEKEFSKYLLNYPYPSVDLFIRTGGEYRLSDFMLWDLAYSECYFTGKLWPDFDKTVFSTAIKWFNSRERRFGMISEQL